MPGTTGPDVNTYQIPEVELGDTFNHWRDTTNLTIYKLNKMKMYDSVDNQSIGNSYSSSGLWSPYLLPTIQSGHTFTNRIIFSAGITTSSIYSSGGVTVGSNGLSVLGGGLIVVGGISASNGITFGGLVYIGEGVGVSSGITLGGNGYVFGNFQVGSAGNLFVDTTNARVGIGSTTLPNGTEKLVVTGGVTVSGQLTVGAGVTASALDVSGVSRFNGGVTFNAVSDHAAAARFNAGVTASALDVIGVSRFNGGVTFNAVSDHVGATRFNAGATASVLDVSGVSRFNGGVTFNAVSDHVGATRFNAGATASVLDVTNTTKLNGSVVMASTLYQSGGSAQFLSGLTASVLDVTGTSKFGGNITAPNVVYSVNGLRGAIVSVGLTSGKLSQFAATSSADLEGVISDETGSGGVLVFNASPVLVTPNLGTPSGMTGTNLTGTALGFTAGFVKYNAPLTGDVTSGAGTQGNVTAIASGVISDVHIASAAAIADSKLAQITSTSKVANSATTAIFNPNTPSTIVARDSFGGFTTGTITATAVTVSAATVSTNTTSGALTVVGGVGIGGALNVAGIVYGSGGVVPIGGIIMWYGTIVTIPNNWALCNGQTVNSLTTPDLRDKFIIGASADATVAKTNVTGSLTQTGGSKNSDLHQHTHVNTAAATNLLTASANHSHNYTAYRGQANGGGQIYDAFYSNQDGVINPGAVVFTSSAATPAITVSGSVSVAMTNPFMGSGSGVNANLPPYHALAYIMRIA